MLFTALPGPRQAAAAMPRLIDALRPGATWVDMTTNDRDLVLKLAQRADHRGRAGPRGQRTLQLIAGVVLGVGIGTAVKAVAGSIPRSSGAAAGIRRRGGAPATVGGETALPGLRP